MEQIRFDDIDALQAAVTEEFGDWGPEFLVSQDKVNAFADLTGDHQWIHVDVERAKKESPFGGPVAHGFLTLSLLPVLAPRDRVQIVGHKTVVNYGADGHRFLAPVPCDSSVHARSRLAAVTRKARGTLVCTETAVHVVGQQRPALSYKGLVLYLG